MIGCGIDVAIAQIAGLDVVEHGFFHTDEDLSRDIREALSQLHGRIVVVELALTIARDVFLLLCAGDDVADVILHLVDVLRNGFATVGQIDAGLVDGQHVRLAKDKQLQALVAVLLGLVDGGIAMIACAAGIDGQTVFHQERLHQTACPTCGRARAELVRCEMGYRQIGIELAPHQHFGNL